MEGYDDRPPPSHRPRHCRRWCCWWSRMWCELMWEFIFHLIFWASVTPTRPLFSTVMKNFTPSSPHEDDNEHVEQHCSHNNIMIVNDWGALVSTVCPLSYRVISSLPYFLSPCSNANAHPRVDRRSARKRIDADDDDISHPRVRQRSSQYQLHQLPVEGGLHLLLKYPRNRKLSASKLLLKRLRIGFLNSGCRIEKYAKRKVITDGAKQLYEAWLGENML